MSNEPQLAGDLIRAGTMTVEGEEVTGLFIRMTVEELRAVEYLPMYRRVAIVKVDAPPPP